MKEFYKFKFYMNSTHRTMFDGKLGASHPHTWEILINIGQFDQQVFQFNEVEAHIKNFINQYEGKSLNELHPFDKINPTMENISKVFYSEIEKLLNKSGWELITMELSENPSRTYVIKSLEEASKINETDMFDVTYHNLIHLDSIKEEKIVDTNIDRNNSDAMFPENFAASYSNIKEINDVFLKAKSKIAMERHIRRKNAFRKVALFFLTFFVHLLFLGGLL